MLRGELDSVPGIIITLYITIYIFLYFLTRLSSLSSYYLSLSTNFIREHFDGESCSELYEVSNITLFFVQNASFLVCINYRRLSL